MTSGQSAVPPSRAPALGQMALLLRQSSDRFLNVFETQKTLQRKREHLSDLSTEKIKELVCII